MVVVTPNEIQQIALKITLILDSPASVKQQVKQITFAQKQLRVIQKELSASVRQINQQAAQASADTLFSVLSDITGHHKQAGSIRAAHRRSIQYQKQRARQPYLELKEAIDSFIMEGNRLKLLAEEYLSDPEGVTARIQAEEEQRRLAEEERKRLEEEIKLKQRQAAAALRANPFPAYGLLFVGILFLAFIAELFTGNLVWSWTNFIEVLGFSAVSALVLLLLGMVDPI